MTISNDIIKLSDDFASEYDASIKTKHWHGPDVLFGLLYEYIKPGQTLLDIGIGTGLSSNSFKKAGLEIYGVDGSKKMLKICRGKKIATDLKKMDIKLAQDPFPGKIFDYVISNGVFHIIGDLEPVFSIINSKISSNGYIGFTVDDKVCDEPDGYTAQIIKGIFEKRHPQSGIMMFKHQKEYICEILERFGFELKKKLRFQAFLDEEENVSYYFVAYIARRIKK